ncbi:MAG TPA: ATP-binding protein [Syntrophorhabdales bacterium]|nr:ATP-binding protein [Syntrophorhabdales bacterium]
MKIPVFARVLVGYLVIILMLSAASLLAFSDAFHDLYRQTLSNDLKSLAFTLRSGLAESVDQGIPGRLESSVRRLGKELRTRITVIDTSGTVLADSDENPRVMENHRNRPEVREALEGNVGSSTRFSSTTSQEAVYVAIPLGEEGKSKGVLRVSLFVRDSRFPPGLTGRMVRIGLLLSFLALIGAYLISRSISRPILDLTAASERLAAGDFDTRVFLRRNDEFRTLADTFNSMSREIKTAFEGLNRQRAELKSIIDSLKEGLIVINKRGEIVYYNESLKTIIGKESIAEGELYWEALGQPQFMELVEKARNGKLNPLEEVEIGGKEFLCSATGVRAQDEIVLVLHDITSMKELERIKRDLVSSVSHELRTPLTSIKGFAETLEEEVDEKNRHYVEIIRRNTDRLINIVRDLLLLSQMEEAGVEIEVEEVDLRKLAENTVRIFDGQLKEKGLALALDIESGLPEISADPFKIEQMLINLLDNAIKYTDRGEVGLAVRREDRKVVIEVRDTGIGIPRGKLTRIFERFYVVDKSRSRKTGGTGLGLSIVKHIVLLHGGEISVDSEPGQGSTFRVKLPLQPPV